MKESISGDEHSIPVHNKLVATSFSNTIRDILDGNIDRNDLCAIEPGTWIKYKNDLAQVFKDYTYGYLDDYNPNDVNEVAHWLWDNIPWYQSRNWKYTVYFKDRCLYMRAVVRET